MEFYVLVCDMCKKTISTNRNHQEKFFSVDYGPLYRIKHFCPECYKEQEKDKEIISPLFL